jgi:hypothetical protein
MPTAADAVRTAFVYLSETDPLGRAPYDAVLGFGMFDLTLPVFCGDLYASGQARRIIFTGGIGAGTGDLGAPEGEVWRRTLASSHPAIVDTDVIVESRSTNTGENVLFTTTLLETTHPRLAFGAGTRRVIVVASPTRLRRASLTLRRHHPALDVIRQLPRVTMEQDAARYAAQGIDYVRHIAGELDRLVDYPRRGWIVGEPLPTAIAAARDVLRASDG